MSFLDGAAAHIIAAGETLFAFHLNLVDQYSIFTGLDHKALSVIGRDYLTGFSGIFRLQHSGTIKLQLFAIEVGVGSRI